MAFERNDIVNKTRLAGELGEELMGFEHNDIVTVDVMNKAIEEGGGDSDFTTATVTVNGGGSSINVIAPYIDADDVLNTEFPLSAGASLEKTVVLYKGEVVMFCSDADVIAVTGNATIDDGMAIITGDCTVTFE